MKKILFRKILFDCLKFFIITIFGIGSIVWVFQAVNYLDIMVEDGRNYQVYFEYTILSFPKIISKIFPFVIFLFHVSRKLLTHYYFHILKLYKKKIKKLQKGKFYL